MKVEIINVSQLKFANKTNNEKRGVEITGYCWGRKLLKKVLVFFSKVMYNGKS